MWPKRDYRDKSFYNPEIRRAFLALICFLIFTGIFYYPLSFQPFRYSYSHRTVSQHVMLMYYFTDYLRWQRFPSFYTNIWAYPEGGTARVIAIPSLVMGGLLCKWTSPRSVFNLLFMGNFVLSGLSFYFVGRKIGLKTLSSIIFGLIVVFHPCIQSFILRGQIENTLLWPVGFTIFMLILLLTSRNKAVPFISCCLLPLLILYSTPYYIIFFIFLYPFLFFFLLYRFHINYKDHSIIWFIVSIVIVILLTVHLIEFYRPPKIESSSKLVDLFPTSLRLGISHSTRTDSMLDLVWPGRLLYNEKPYLGITFLVGLFFSLIHRIVSRYRCKEFTILLAGTLFFIALAMGRNFSGSGSSSISFLANFIDRIYIDFQKVIKLYRALPFMAICGGILIASTVNRLNSKIATFVFLTFIISIMSDNFAVRFFSKNMYPILYYDERVDMDPVIITLPKRRMEDLPVVDFPPPPPEFFKIWQRYTYFQTEHLQKLVWADVNPNPSYARGLIKHLYDFYYNPELYLENKEKAEILKNELKNARVGLIILHKEFIPKEKADFLLSALDFLFPRFNESERIIVWKCKN